MVLQWPSLATEYNIEYIFLVKGLENIYTKILIEENIPYCMLFLERQLFYQWSVWSEKYSAATSVSFFSQRKPLS